jgi:hypothetical protein
MRTQADLYQAALRRLRLVQQGSVGGGHQTQTTLKAYEVLYEQLAEEEIAYWDYHTSNEVIPLHIFPALTDYLAAYVAPELGAETDIDMRATIAQLQSLTAKLWTGEPTAVDRF